MTNSKKKSERENVEVSHVQRVHVHRTTNGDRNNVRGAFNGQIRVK